MLYFRLCEYSCGNLYDTTNITTAFFLITNFRRVLNIVCFLLGNSPASEFYMPMLRNTLSVLSSQAGRCEEWTRFEKCWGNYTRKGLGRKYPEPNLFSYKYPKFLKRSHSPYISAYKDGTECSETSAYKIQTPGNYPEESILLYFCHISLCFKYIGVYAPWWWRVTAGTWGRN
jgi:hypothetical protein